MIMSLRNYLATWMLVPLVLALFIAWISGVDFTQRAPALGWTWGIGLLASAAGFILGGMMEPDFRRSAESRIELIERARLIRAERYRP